MKTVVLPKTKLAVQGAEALREQRVTAWILILVLLGLIIAASYEFWAKAGAAWPF